MSEAGLWPVRKRLRLKREKSLFGRCCPAHLVPVSLSKDHCFCSGRKKIEKRSTAQIWRLSETGSKGKIYPKRVLPHPGSRAGWEQGLPCLVYIVNAIYRPFALETLAKPLVEIERRNKIVCNETKWDCIITHLKMQIPYEQSRTDCSFIFL